MPRRTRFLLLLACAIPFSVRAEDFQPDPRCVQRYGPAYRYPQAGWIVLHIEGEPYERGVQHGRLLAPEIAAKVHCLALKSGYKAPADSWKHVRTVVNALFLRGYPAEQLEEMKGIADGASASGAHVDGRPIDLLDIVVINAGNELDALDAALQATPTGLEGLELTPDRDKPKSPAVSQGLPGGLRNVLPGHAPGGQDRPSRSMAQTTQRYRPQRCSAFAATGPATKNGKVVFGHITMWDLYPANFYNVWLDIKPRHGHRFVMQTYPGGMHSGMDYSINDAGMLLCETTLDQTSFNVRGAPLAARIRQAVQYADSIDKTVEILTKDNNGLSTEEWILADLKTNEIAMLALGTRKSKLRRSSKNEWIAGAEGFYWSCNNTKDRDVRLETIPAVDARPSAAAVFAPSRRDIAWLEMYDRYKGKIDADFARVALTTPKLVTALSVDAKYTTADLAGQLKSWAAFGPPVGPTWQPTVKERQQYPDVQPLVSNPWALVHTGSPAPSEESLIPVVDLHDWTDGELPAPAKNEPDPPTTAAWHGTLLPRADADVWLSTGFANYERIVALERALRSDGHKLAATDRDHLAVYLCYYRSIYELGARRTEDTPLASTRSNPRDDDWYKVATGKGVLLLHTLRGLVGEKDFDRLMDEFGRANAGKEVTAAQFQAHVEHGTGRDWQEFFQAWLNRPGLPRLKLGKIETRHSIKKWTTSVTLVRDKAWPSMVVPVTVDTAHGEETEVVRLDREEETVEIRTTNRPLQVVVDKYGLTARGNGGPFSILSCEGELDQSLIIYGTLDEESTNREAAHLLQAALRQRDQKVAMAIRKDSDVTAAELHDHHLLLIGRPDSNRLVARFRDALPVSFGPRSVEVRDEAYAHPESAVLMAAENPLNKRYAVLVVAGLEGRSTLRAAQHFEKDNLAYAEVLALPHNLEERAIVVSPKELTRDLDAPKSAK